MAKLIKRTPRRVMLRPWRILGFDEVVQADDQWYWKKLASNEDDWLPIGASTSYQEIGCTVQGNQSR